MDIIVILQVVIEMQAGEENPQDPTNRNDHIAEIIKRSKQVISQRGKDIRDGQCDNHLSMNLLLGKTIEYKGIIAVAQKIDQVIDPDIFIMEIYGKIFCDEFYSKNEKQVRYKRY